MWFATACSEPGAEGSADAPTKVGTDSEKGAPAQNLAACDACRSKQPCFEAQCTEDLTCEMIPKDSACEPEQICSALGSCVPRQCESIEFPWVLSIRVSNLVGDDGYFAYLWLGQDGIRVGIRRAVVSNAVAVFEIEGVPLGKYEMLLFADPEEDVFCDSRTNDVFDLGSIDYSAPGTTYKVSAEARRAAGCNAYPLPGDYVADNGLDGLQAVEEACRDLEGDGCVSTIERTCQSQRLGSCGFGIPHDVNFDGVVDSRDRELIESNLRRGCS